MSALVVPIRRLAHASDLPLPAYATEHSAGLDLLAAVDAPLDLAPGARGLVPTGIAIALPDGYEAQVRARSGLALHHGIGVLNAPGTIDGDYRGEIAVILINHGTGSFRIGRGDRIAQLVVAPVARTVWREDEDLTESARAGGGFGSTGVGTDEQRARKG